MPTLVKIAEWQGKIAQAKEVVPPVEKPWLERNWPVVVAGAGIALVSLLAATKK